MSEIPNVCFIDDVARELRTSRSTIEKLRRHGCFPIPEIPSIAPTEVMEAPIEPQQRTAQ